MTRGQSAEIAVLKVQMTQVQKDIEAMRSDMKASTDSARADRQRQSEKLDTILDEMRANNQSTIDRNAATNARIDAYENQAKGASALTRAVLWLWPVIVGFAAYIASGGRLPKP